MRQHLRSSKLFPSLACKIVSHVPLSQENRTGIYTARVNDISIHTLNSFVDSATITQWAQKLDRDFNATNPSPGARAQYKLLRPSLDPSSSQPVLECVALWLTSTAGTTLTVLRLFVAPASAAPDLVQPNSSYIQICVMPLHPFSRGSIHIQSDDPFQAPAIDLNAWSLDIGTFVATTLHYCEWRPYSG